MPTFIKDTFPVVCDIDNFGVVVSIHEDVPGYGGGGGNLSEMNIMNRVFDNRSTEKCYRKLICYCNLFG